MIQKSKLKTREIRRYLKRVKVRLIRFSTARPGFFLSHFILKWLNFRHVKILPLSSEGSCSENLYLLRESKYEVVAPSLVCSQAQRRKGVYGEVRAYALSHVLCSAYTPVIASKCAALFPQQVSEGFDRFFLPEVDLFFRSGGHVSVTQKPDIYLKSGVLVGGAGASNWYHFVIECLPKVFLAQSLPAKFNEFPLLVPDECRYISSFADALQVFSKNRELIYLQQKKIVAVDHLVVFDEVSFGPFNMPEGVWPSIKDYSQHEELLTRYFEVLRKGVLSDHFPSRQNRRLFIARSERRRSYNQDELIKIINGYGFEVIFPENMSLAEQAQAFSESEIVVGPSGAAWVGMLFCSRPIKGLTWLPSVYWEFCSYSTIAGILDHKLSFLEAAPDYELRKTGDVYVASYRISPHEFELALKAIL